MARRWHTAREHGIQSSMQQERVTDDTSMQQEHMAYDTSMQQEHMAYDIGKRRLPTCRLVMSSSLTNSSTRVVAFINMASWYSSASGANRVRLSLALAAWRRRALCDRGGKMPGKQHVAQATPAN